MWLTAGREPGHLAVVTQTGSAASVTESAGQIWAELARRYGPSLVLLEHHLTPEAGRGRGDLNLVRIGADGSPHWLAVWPTQPGRRPRPSRQPARRDPPAGQPAEAGAHQQAAALLTRDPAAHVPLGSPCSPPGNDGVAWCPRIDSDTATMLYTGIPAAVEEMRQVSERATARRARLRASDLQ